MKISETIRAAVSETNRVTRGEVRYAGKPVVYDENARWYEERDGEIRVCFATAMGLKLGWWGTELSIEQQDLLTGLQLLRDGHGEGIEFLTEEEGDYSFWDLGRRRKLSEMEEVAAWLEKSGW